MIKRLAIGLAVILPILLGALFAFKLLVAVAVVLGVLVLAYGIGDILLTEYRWLK